MALSAAQQQFSATLSQLTGLDPHVVAAWVTAESGGATTTRGTNNFLNFGHPNEPSFPTPQAGAMGTYQFLLANSNYRGILSSATGTPPAQLQAIINSPWDTSHYNNGANLLKDYSAAGGSLSQALQTPLSLPSATPNTPSTASGPSDSDCIVSIPIPFPGIDNICIHRSQGRALAGGVAIVAGGLVILVGLVILATGASPKIALGKVQSGDVDLAERRQRVSEQRERRLSEAAAARKPEPKPESAPTYPKRPPPTRSNVLPGVA